jgi:hypothetical protein
LDDDDVVVERQEFGFGGRFRKEAIAPVLRILL